MDNFRNYPRITLSLLWTAIMFLMVFADVFSIIVELEVGNTVDIPINVRTAMTIAAVVTSIPILMIILSWILPYKINRIVNIVGAVLTCVYVVGGGSAVPHYIVMAVLELVLLVSVMAVSLKWK